jgi:DNA-binding winged helix-turn-helix (wHTH) protein/Tol biopolymer transport system component
MPTSPSGPRKLKFGVFEANFASQELRKHGTRVRLRGQSFALLQLLVGRAGEIVTRDEMKATLWPSDTFVDFENGLNAAIKKLRAVLGDSPENPRYIETIPKSGYRFIAPVKDLGSMAEPVPEALSQAHAATKETEKPVSQATWGEGRRFKLWTLAAAAAILLAVVALGALRPASPPRVTRGTAITNSARVDAYGRLQTDGARLFFLERHGHRWTLMQIPVAGGEAQPFANPFENTRLFSLSPDGAEMIVAPFSQRGEALPLWMIPSVGGAPRRLGEISALDAVFTPNGKEITYCTHQGIFQVLRDGLNPRQLVKMEGQILGLGWSPAGDLLRFEVRNPQGTISTLWEVRSDGSGLQVVLPDWAADSWQSNGRWTADGRYYLFSGVRTSGASSIWAIPTRHGFWSLGRGIPMQLTSGPVVMDQALPSSDGKRLFSLGVADRFEYVKVDEKGAARGLLGGSSAAWATFSTDGEWMTYTQDGALWRSKPDGSDKRQLAPPALSPSVATISPDGKLVAFQGHSEGQQGFGIYVVDAGGGSPKEVVAGKYAADAPVWSGTPDDFTLTYSQEGEDGNGAALDLLHIATGRSEQIPSSAGYWKSKWSPDGRYLAAVGDDQKRLVVYDSATKNWTELLKGGHAIGPVAWTRDSSTVAYQDLGDPGQPVHLQRLKEGKPTGAAETANVCKELLEGGVQRCGFEGLAPDGGFLLRLTRGDRDVYSFEMELP